MFRYVNLRLLAIPVFLIFALILGFLSTQTSQTTSTAWLSVSGRYLKDPGGKTVILRGVSLADISVANSRTRNANALIDIATDHVNGWYAHVIRLPVYPDAIDGQPGWKANPEAYFAKHLDPAVQRCIIKQIYCIIDWHYIKDYNSSEVDTATRAFWSYVAPKYASTPNVIFELYNEPIYPDSWSTWKTTAQPWVDLIRAAAPKNLILIGGPRWSQNVAEAATSPFTGSNLMYVAHLYPEQGGQSVWEAWFGKSSNTVPYFITEWGWQQGGNAPTNGTKSGYGVPFSAYLDSKGVSWTAWVFDDYWQPVMFDTSWKLLGGEAYMGEFIKDFLYQHRNDNLPGGGTGKTATTAPVHPTATYANLPINPTNAPASTGTLKVQLVTGGADNNQQSAFRYRIQNTGSSAQSNISVRIYFTPDGSLAASNYVLEKYYDQSGSAIVSGPTLASGSTYFFTIKYGTTSLPAGAAWEYQTALRLNAWASNYDGTNDWWHAIGTLPVSYIDWINIPVYVSGTRVWGTEPSASGDGRMP
jgi:endoglucanase